jgi:hypothetical protein
MSSVHFTAETSSNGVVERDFTLGEVTDRPALSTAAEGVGAADRQPSLRQVTDLRLRSACCCRTG